MTDDDIALAQMLQEADDHWTEKHRKRWITRRLLPGLLPAAILVAGVFWLFN